eukprot:CAMPEP_0172361014 /NCGR_PEP_ID=MMETSP1060-20121228/4923_1 /TAXON_ID=37318 /ORGANISM="Pseudo-nitzschia pungens, Strain cf. cingulata" /LENGTH=412 /DNA_ID=CAMNT_0013083151 /DNA_START=164 /DNA_END=1400 /DNA_ORIENTATION=+
MAHVSYTSTTIDRSGNHPSWKKLIVCASYVLFAIHDSATYRFADGLSAPNRGNHRTGSLSSRRTRTGTRNNSGSSSSESGSDRPNAISRRRRSRRTTTTTRTMTRKTRARPEPTAPWSERVAEKTVVILYNKPANLITSHESQDARGTVYDDVESMRGFLPKITVEDPKNGENPPISFETATGIRSKLHAIGRLDADTTGLLLLTNDGRLVHHVTNPNSKTQEHERYNTDASADSTTTASKPSIIRKTYEALIMGHHTEESLEPLRRGVDIGKQCVTQPLPERDDLKILDHPNHKSTVVSITIGEGKNRQVRKMFHAIGSGVMKLKRTRIGRHLTLEGVNEGEWRVLTDNEVQRFLGWNPRELPPLSPAGSPPNHRKQQQQQQQQRRRRRPGGAGPLKRREDGGGDDDDDDD